MAAQVARTESHWGKTPGETWSCQSRGCTSNVRAPEWGHAARSSVLTAHLSRFWVVLGQQGLLPPLCQHRRRSGAMFLAILSMQPGDSSCVTCKRCCLASALRQWLIFRS